MEINKEHARVILEMVGHIEDYQSNTIGEENLDSEIRKNFPELADYDYQDEKEKYGW